MSLTKDNKDYTLKSTKARKRRYTFSFHQLSLDTNSPQKRYEVVISMGQLKWHTKIRYSEMEKFHEKVRS